MSAPLELSGLSVDIARRPVLRDVDLVLATGEVVGVIGANGSGKTTLIRAALGLIRPAAGEARLAGQAARALSPPRRAALAGYLPQERRVAWNMPAERVAALGAARAAPAAALALARAALAEVGLADLAGRGVRDMSGGERARVLLARLLVTGAPLLVADEPAAGLDADAALRVMAILRARAAAGAAVLVTLHDLTLAARACDRLAVLAGGRLLALAAPEIALAADTLRAAFGLEGELLATPRGWLVDARRADQW
jgi:iron complex transport system ATP-binding protein